MFQIINRIPRGLAVSGGGASSLADYDSYLKAVWAMEETSGTRADSVNSHDLTDNNTVLYGTGKYGNAADFDLANVEYLSVADHADIAPDDSMAISLSKSISR